MVALWCGRPVGRSVYGHVITKFSRMDRFFSFGAPPRRAWSSAKNKLRNPQRNKLARKPGNLRGSRVEFQEMGDRFATLIECCLFLEEDQTTEGDWTAQLGINGRNARFKLDTVAAVTVIGAHTSWLKDQKLVKPKQTLRGPENKLTSHTAREKSLN